MVQIIMLWFHEFYSDKVSEKIRENTWCKLSCCDFTNFAAIEFPKKIVKTHWSKNKFGIVISRIFLKRFVNQNNIYRILYYL